MYFLNIIQSGPFALRVHLIVTLAALLLGLCVMLLKKGTPRHRVAGYVWLALMYAGIATSFFITVNNPGHYTITHAYSVLFFCTISLGLWCRHKRYGIAHAVLMGGTYLWSGTLTMINFFPFKRVQEIVSGLL